MHPAAPGLVLLIASLAPTRAIAEIRVPDTMRVEQCVARARTRAPALQAADLEREAAAGDSAVAAFNRRPEVALRASATVAPSGFYDPTITNLGDYELRLGFDWTLADGGRRARDRERGRLEALSARGVAERERRDAGLEAAALAFHLLHVQESGETQRLALEWLARLGSLVRSGVASGVRSPADSVRVALERDATAAEFESTWLERRATILELDAVLDRGEDTLVVIRDPNDPPDRLPDAADSLQLMASIEQLPEAALDLADAARARLEELDARYRAALDLGLSLDAGLAGADLTRAVPEPLRDTDPGATFGDRVRRDLGASVAVRVRLPLLDPTVRLATGARAASRGAAEVRVRAGTEARRREALRLLAVWRSAFVRVQASIRTREAAERNLLKEKSLYSAGATTLLELLDARRVYADALERLAQVREESRMAQFEVEDRR